MIADPHENFVFGLYRIQSEECHCLAGIRLLSQRRDSLLRFVQAGASSRSSGYALGEYQDHWMMAGQVEYRRELFWRLGAVAYLGAGEVAKSFSDLNWNDTLPGGGIGARFALSRESHVNLRVDYAWGQDSSALYVSIAEAF